MSFSKQYFGKELNDIHFEDIEQYFKTPQKESDKIEFKSFNSTDGIEISIKPIIKGVCAFLNSGGGLLIWGAPVGTEEKGKKEKIFQGELQPITKEVEHDQLVNKISDKITPLPVSFILNVLEKEEKSLVIIEIQESPYSPHQTDNTYYMRLDGISRPAPHHYIEALFKEINYPNLEGYIRFDKISYDRNFYYLDFTFAIFNFSPLQNEEIVFIQITCPEGKYSKYYPLEPLNYTLNGHQLTLTNFIDVLHFAAPVTQKETLFFEPLEITRAFKNVINITLAFGGKYSPFKTSEYKLNLTNIDWDKPTNLDYLIFYKEENIAGIDKHKQLGITRESSIKSFLDYGKI